jgi:hypothetical protein
VQPGPHPASPRSDTFGEWRFETVSRRKRLASDDLPSPATFSSAGIHRAGPIRSF